MPPPNPIEHASKLARRTIDSQKDLIPHLLKARDRIENDILRAARNRRFATSVRIRDGLYKQLSEEYRRMQGNLDGWTQGSVRSTSKEWRALAVDDMKGSGEDFKVVKWTKFNKKYVKDYFERIHPFNAEKLAAVNVHMNPQLTKMLESDVRQLRAGVVDVFRESVFTGMTARERQKLLEETVIHTGKNLNSWQFIDRSGKRWKNGNYFNMLNRTITNNTARAAYNDTLVDGGFDLVEIIGADPGVNPGCTAWVNHIVSISGTSDKYPPISAAEADKVFHPNCVHTTVLASEKVPESAALLAEQEGAGPPEVDWGPKGKPKPKPKISTKTVPALTKSAADVKEQEEA